MCTTRWPLSLSLLGACILWHEQTQRLRTASSTPQDISFFDIFLALVHNFVAATPLFLFLLLEAEPEVFDLFAQAVYLSVRVSTWLFVLIFHRNMGLYIPMKSQKIYKTYNSYMAIYQ